MLINYVKMQAIAEILEIGESNPKKLYFHKKVSNIFSGVGTYLGMAVMHGGSCMIEFYTIHASNNPLLVVTLCFATCEVLLLALMV